MSKWSPITRGIMYDQESVAEACDRRAERARRDSNDRLVQYWSTTAANVREGKEHPQAIAKEILVDEEIRDSRF